MQQDSKRMEILRKAMEIEAAEKGYYEKAAAAAENPIAKKLFERLAFEEDAHAKKFRELEAQLGKSADWPAGEAPSWEGKELKLVFAGLKSASPQDVKVAKTELDAMQAAMGRELQAYDMYRTRSEESTSPAEKRFYQVLAGEERMHHLALLDSYEYLTDPAGWFTVKEKWTLEG
ncbi:MAG: ferritin family protein [Dehalococcoidia bacterium]|nr:ferritin family protein [Dehalococcoidia bacterium]